MSVVGFELTIYDYSKIYLGLSDAARELPKPRHDGRPPVQAGRITAFKRSYDVSMTQFGPERAAGATYDPATGRLAFDYCGPGNYDPNAEINFVIYGPPTKGRS